MPGPVQVRPRPHALPRRLMRSVLGDVLRRIRLRQRRTLADVAGTARVSIAYLSELERGRKEASSEVLAAICDALRVDLSAVLTEVGRELAPGPAVAPLAAPATGPAGPPLTAVPPVSAVSSAALSGDVLCMAA
jgi:transcriptional regulator with XRE-family HTH domain